MNAFGSEALYLYAIALEPGPLPTLEAPSLDGGPVDAVRYEDLVAVTHACRPEAYQGDDDEVRTWILAHNAVVEEAWRAAGSVLPMSFDSIVRARDGLSPQECLLRWLEAHHEALRERLATLAGRSEVSVKVFCGDDDAAVAKAGGEAGRRRQGGHAYFEQRASRRRLAHEKTARADVEAKRHYERLAELASEVRVNEARSARGRKPILDVSLLGDQTQLEEIGEYLEAVVREPGVEVAFTGVWPPYSFAGVFGPAAKQQDTQGDTAATGQRP